MKKIDMQFHNMKLRKPFIAFLLSLGLSQPVIGLELQNKTGDDIKISIRGYDKSNNQKIQTLELKANATGKVTIDNCPTIRGIPGGKACSIRIASEHSPYHTGTHTLSNNTEKDETFVISISGDEYSVSPE